MRYPEPNIKINVDRANPGQFFACCGLLELADRLWPGAEGWFDDDHFFIACESQETLTSLQDAIRSLTVTNTMTEEQTLRFDVLGAMSKKHRREKALDEEKKQLDSLRRESPIRLTGRIDLVIDWFRDDHAGGSRFKTWAGQQSVIDIAVSMHAASREVGELWSPVYGVGLPFNFDSDLGTQGSAIDLGFSLDPLSSSAATRLESSCRPSLELLCFIGLQRFRPSGMGTRNKFGYLAWTTPSRPSIAAALASYCVETARGSRFEFSLLYRTKYLKSFLPATPLEGVTP